MNSDWEAITKKSLESVEEIDGTVEEDFREKRMNICKSCKELKNFYFCGVCGCYLPLKTFFKVFDCPEGKWPKNE